MQTSIGDGCAASVRRQKRSLWWQHPAKTRWPLAVELAIKRVQRATSTPHSTEYREIFRDAPVAGGRRARVRSKRSDGAINTGSMLCSAIASADLGNGLIGKPIGGKWERKSWDDLGGLAFGELIAGAVSEKRAERCAAELVAIGFIRIQQWRVVQGNGEVRSEPGIKHITDRCWRALGVYGHVQRERRRRDRERKAKRIATVASLIPSSSDARRPGRPQRPLPRVANPMREQAYVKPPHEPPIEAVNGAPVNVKAELDAIAAKLGLPKRW